MSRLFTPKDISTLPPCFFSQKIVTFYYSLPSLSFTKITHAHTHISRQKLMWRYSVWEQTQEHRDDRHIISSCNRFSANFCTVSSVFRIMKGKKWTPRQGPDYKFPIFNTVSFTKLYFRVQRGSRQCNVLEERMSCSQIPYDLPCVFVEINKWVNKKSSYF